MKKNFFLALLLLPILMVTTASAAQIDFLDAAYRACKERVGEDIEKVSYGTGIDLLQPEHFLGINIFTAVPGHEYHFEQYFGSGDKSQMQLYVDSFEQVYDREHDYYCEHKMVNDRRGLEEWKRKYHSMGLLTVDAEDANDLEHLLSDRVLSYEDWRRGIKAGLYVLLIKYDNSFTGYLMLYVPEYNRHAVKPDGWYQTEIDCLRQELASKEEELCEAQEHIDRLIGYLAEDREAENEEIQRLRDRLRDYLFNQPNGLRVELGMSRTHRNDYDGRMNDLLFSAGVGWSFSNGLGAVISGYYGEANFDFWKEYPASAHFQGRSHITSLGAAHNAGWMLIFNINPRAFGNWSLRFGGGLDFIWDYDQQVQEYLVGSDLPPGEPHVIADVKATRSSWMLGAGYNINRELSIGLDLRLVENDSVLLGPLADDLDQATFAHSFTAWIGYTF